MELRHEINKSGKISFFRYEPGEKRAKVNKKIATSENGQIQRLTDNLTVEEEKEISRIASEQGQKQRVKRVVDSLLQLKNEDAKELSCNLKSLNLEEEIVSLFALLQAEQEEMVEEEGDEVTQKSQDEQQSRDQILILCEGETEESYLRSISQHLGIGCRVAVKAYKTCPTPLGLVRQCAKEVCFDEATDRKLIGAWAVFDRDQHLTYQEAFAFAERFPRVHIAWSNPCFEIWMMMHFARLPGLFTRTEELVKFVEESRVDEPNNITVVHQIKKIEKLYSPTLCLKRLKEYWPGYEKNGKNYLKVTGSRIGFAFEEQSIYTTDPNNLGSNMSSLIQCMLDMAGKTVEDGFEIEVQPRKAVMSMSPKEFSEELTKESENDLTTELLNGTINYLQALKCTKTLNLSKNVSGKLDRLREKLMILNNTVQ